jgi:hypothetical protein
MADKQKNYTEIDNSYNDLLEREIPVYSSAPPYQAPPQVYRYTFPAQTLDRNDPSLSPSQFYALTNFLLRGYLQSPNYSTHAVGFKLNGLTGSAEFNDLTIDRLNLSLPPGTVLFQGPTQIEGDLNLLSLDTVNKLFGVFVSNPLFNFQVAGTAGFKRPTLYKNNNYHIQPEESNAIYVCSGSDKKINLPPIEEGLIYSFYLETDHNFTINAEGFDIIRVGNVDSDPGGYTRGNGKGSVLNITAIDGIWVTQSLMGNWLFAWQVVPNAELVSVTELINVTIVHPESLNDSTTVSESVTVSVSTHSMNNSVNDSTTTSESVTVVRI